MIYAVLLLCVSYTSRFVDLPGTSAVVLSSCPSSFSVDVAGGSSINVGVIVVGRSSFSVDGVEPASVCIVTVDSTPFRLVVVCTSAVVVLSFDRFSATMQTFNV